MGMTVDASVFFYLFICSLIFLCEGQGGEGDVRLAGGGTDNEGRVEVYHNGRWGTVCDDDWDLNDATVVCRQLGYNEATAAPQQAAFGAGSGPIQYDNVDCTGSETRLADCPNSGIGIEDCFHSEDAGVVCDTPIQNSSTIRLVGGTTQYEGRVEVYHNGEWQTVCDDSWDIDEAQVVCRQLGYGSAVSALSGAYFGEGSGDQWEASWHCSGSEASLESCRTTSSSCSHSEDASVRCSSSNVNIAAIIGGVVGGVVAAGLCFSITLCICITVCCCYRRKKAKSPTTAATSTPEVQTAAVVSASQTAVQDPQQHTMPPEYNPDVLPPAYPAAAPLYPTVGGPLPTGYPPQQTYAAEPTDLPPPYPSAPPTTAPQ